ncbi:hypothetical protein LTR22_020207 [Elasticomyces elasticus]|nr:hypothetical protein LTR22_020207 [Elasticomyces elasticus]KAK5754808.1 hypothetical protein LTS12_015125 [Elasticomyces elasticus]
MPEMLVPGYSRPKTRHVLSKHRGTIFINEYRRNDDGNDRYTGYETFIRANSDLDQRTPFFLSEDVTVNGHYCHEAEGIGWHYRGVKAYHAPVDKPNWWYV